MAQVQDSTIPGSPSLDTAIPVWLVPETDDESVLSEETIQRLREPLRIAIPVRVLPGIDDEKVSIEIPVRLLPGVTPSPPQPASVTEHKVGSAAVTLPMIPASAAVRLPPETTTQSVIGDESEELILCRRDDKAPVTLPPEWTVCASGSAPVTLPPELSPSGRDKKGIDMDCAKYKKYEKLRRAAIDDDWHVVKKFIDNDPEAWTAPLSDTGQTILHYMVNSKNIIELVSELVEKIEPKDLKHVDEHGLTVLSACAIVGNEKAAKIIVGKNPELLDIRDKKKNLPLHYAAQFGHKDMVQFLLAKEENKEKEEDRGPQKEKEALEKESGVKLVENLIASNLYDIALKLLEGHPNLAREQLEDRKKVLETLAQKPLGFESGSQLGFRKRLIYKCIPDSALPHTRKGDEEEPDSANPHTRRGDEEEPNSSLPHSRKDHGEDHKNTSKYCFTKCTQFSGL